MPRKCREFSKYTFAKWLSWSDNGTSGWVPWDGITFELHSESFYSVKLGFISLISSYLDARCGTWICFFVQGNLSHTSFTHIHIDQRTLNLFANTTQTERCTIEEFYSVAQCWVRKVKYLTWMTDGAY